MSNVQAERDWPAGHPKAVDYKGEKYVPPPAPFARDWPNGHPKAADSKANLAETRATIAEQSAPGALGVANPPEPEVEQSQLQRILEAGENFSTDQQ